MISIVLKTFMIFGGLYLLAVLALYLGQRRLVYVPNPERVSPIAAGLSDVDEIRLNPEPGVLVLAWHAPAKPDAPTILYYHGNGGNLAGRVDRINHFRNAGFGVFLMSYRSYSGSTGAPSERANIFDALHAYDWLRGKGHEGGDIVVYGESLGTGVATQVAAQRDVAAVILDAPYSSLVDAAQNAYPYVPVGALLKDSYRSTRFIAKIGAPLLVVHGARDAVIPLELGRTLFSAAVEPKKMVVFPHGGHTDLYDHGAIHVIKSFVDALKR